MSDFRGRKISGLHEYFFDGYEEVEYIDEHGKKRKRLDYHGKIYSFRMNAEQMKALRIRFAVPLVLIYAVLIFSMLHMSALANGFAGAFLAIGILPHFYYTFGFFRFLFLKEEFNNRRLYQSYKRMENGTIIKLADAGLCLLLAVIYMIFDKSVKFDLANILTLLAIVAFGLLVLYERRLISGNRYKVIRDKDRVVENADVSKGEKEATPKPKTLSDFYATAHFYEDEEEEEEDDRKKKRRKRKEKKEAAAEQTSGAENTAGAEETSDAEEDGE